MLSAKKISAFFFLSILTIGYSQSFQHRKFKYDWTDAIKISLEQSPLFKSYEALILYEETTIDITNQNIKRYQVYQFNTTEAINKYNLFRVPITMDQPLARLDNIYRVDSATFPMLLYEKINFFDARIIRKGEIIKAVLDEVAYRNEERTGYRLLPYYLHYFFIRNLEPGDQVEVITSHQWPLFTSKYYLNEILPKQEVNIIVNNSELGQVNVYVNSLLGEFKSNQLSKDKLAYHISFENLLSVDPDLPIQVKDLPRVEFFENKKYELTEKVFGSQKVDTFTWEKILYHFVTRIDPGELRTWENYDVQSYKTSEFFGKLKTNAKGLTGVYLMDYINKYTVDHLKYKNDFNYFIHLEHGFNDLGTFLENGILREASRHEFYYNMIDRINVPYYKTLLQDNRIHTIDTSLTNIIYMDGLSYVLYDNDSTQHIYLPKKGRSGYYTNELPFYYTNQYVRLIPQTVSRKIYDKYPELIQYPLIFIPESNKQDNYKKNIVNIQIDLRDKRTELNEQIELSGQFSTLTRGYYLYNEKDTTISGSYYKSIFSKSATTTCITDTIESTFPFRSKFKRSGEIYNNVFTTIDGSLVIDLSSLINIHFAEIDPQYHFANYQHDFPGSEEFMIELNFDQLVSIESVESYNSSISTESFSLTTSLIKNSDNQYSIKIKWDIENTITLQNDLSKLSDAFKTIKKFFQLKLKVRLQ